MSKRPTIQMIAERAGVSRGTVDRVLNNRSYVKEDVRDRVLKAIVEVGYMSPREVHKQTLADEAFAPLKLGVLLPSWPDYSLPAILGGVEGAQKELNSYNVKILVERCQSDDPDEVNTRLDDLLSRGVQGIAICAVNDILVESKVTAMVEQGIPVITFNSDLPNSKRISFVGQDYVKSGRIAAELVAKFVPRDGFVLAACGNQEFDGHRKRLSGFLERMRELGFPDSQIRIIETYNDYHVTYRKVSETLAEAPDLAAIYMANNSVAGCAKALETAGKKGKVRLVVHDLSESTRQLLESGHIDFTISQDFYRQGYLPLKCLRELLHLGRQPEIYQTNTRISVICSQNMD